jgi:hypothetical protein
MAGSPHDISPEQIQSRIHDGVAAMENGDYLTALNKFEAARVLMSAIPRMNLQKFEIEYTPDQLDATIDRVRRLANRQSSGGMITQQPIKYTRGMRTYE